ncbi:uncharacterized protein ACB057_010540 [Neosynchiropus ocellatus]
MTAKATQADLIQLIYRHLKETGYDSVASELQKHAPQTETNTSTHLIDIYNSWLRDSKKKSRTPKRSISKDKGTPLKASAATSSLDDEGDGLSQSLLPQTPLASSKKTAALTPVKTPAVGSPSKKTAALPVPAAAGDSSDTTDISGDEAKHLTQVKSPQNDANSLTAVTALPIADSSTPKKKQSSAKKAESTKKKPVPVKRKTNNTKSTPKGTKAKKGKSQTEPVAAGGSDSDSDSSLDVEKWKSLLLKMSDSDMARMADIDALDSTPKRPAPKRVRKPRAKPAPKTNPPTETTDKSVMGDQQKDAQTTKKMKKVTKPDSAPPQNQTSTELTASDPAPTKQTSEEERAKDPMSCSEPSGEVSSPKKKKKKHKLSESETKEDEEQKKDDSLRTEETNGDSQEHLSGTTAQLPKHAVGKKKTKKKKEKVSESEAKEEEEKKEDDSVRTEETNSITLEKFSGNDAGVLDPALSKRKTKKKKEKISESETKVEEEKKEDDSVRTEERNSIAKRRKKEDIETESPSDSIVQEKLREDDEGEPAVMAKKKKTQDSVETHPDENQAVDENGRELEASEKVKKKRKTRTLLSGRSEMILENTVIDAKADEMISAASEQTPGKTKKKKKLKEEVETEASSLCETPGPPSEKKKKKSKVKAAEEPE